MRFFFFILTAGMVFCACSCKFDYVGITGLAGHGKEAAFLESLFGEDTQLETKRIRLFSEETKQAPSIFIDILSSWEFEGAYGDIILSKNYFAPMEDSLEGKTATTLASCLDGSQNIALVGEIMPPFVALKVDGLALGDDEYPLARVAGIRIRPAEDRKDDKRLAEKIRFIEDALNNSENTMISAPPLPLWICAGGDVMLERGATQILLAEGAAGIFGKTASMLESADIALLNLEGVISARGERVVKSFNFRFIPETAEALKNAGLDAVLHANNHVFDFGETAFLDSLDHLAKAGIAAVGAGRNIEEASEPFVFKRDDNVVCRVFGIASFPRERNGWDGVTAAALADKPGMLHAGRGGKEALTRRMAQNQDGAINVILFHGGVEWSSAPDAATRDLYTEFVEAGADIVIGTHPHVVQGFEWINGKAVFWSLGNYVFAGMQDMPEGIRGLFLHLGFLDGRLLYLEPFMLNLNQARTDIAPTENLSVFYRRSRQLAER